MPEPTAVSATIDLWDWRRQVAALYAAVRAADDPRRAWSAWRTGRDALFRGHPQSPIEPAARHSFRPLSYFPYEPRLRFAVGLVAATGPGTAVDAGADGTIRLRPFARTDGLMAALGRELTVFWVEGYGGGAFLPFADGTSGGETYGGGRYLLDTIKGADLGTGQGGSTILDFNFAYNPSCSYSPRYVCPLAPVENRLAVAVRAGEMRPQG